MPAPTYHEGMRQLQDLRETRALADRLEKVTMRAAFTDEDKAFIQRCRMFFIATADRDGQPDCSYKGGLPGFVRVIDERTLAIPDYDGNGQYRSWGNVLANPKVGLLFIDFESPKRLRINGTATVSHKAQWPRWTPTPDMIKREPERYRRWAGGMEGGTHNPLGARALYLFKDGRDTLYRIHGTNEPETIGQAVSSGCIRMMNQDVIDLYRRVSAGAKVVVLPVGAGWRQAASRPAAAPPSEPAW